MNDAINKIIKDLEEPIKILNKINLERLKNIKRNINYIINNNIVDEKIIESVFDNLLDLIYFYGEELNQIYFDFLNYYECINKEACNEYKKLYLDIVNEE